MDLVYPRHLNPGTRLDPYDDGLLYTRDLGLIAPADPVRIANPIYREVVIRVLGAEVQANVVADPRSFERTAFDQATSPSGRPVTVLRA